MWIDRINRMLVRRLRRKRGGVPTDIVCDDAGLTQYERSTPLWSIAWQDIDKVTAFVNYGFIGDEMLLAFEASGVTRLAAEDVTGFSEVASRLEGHLAGAIPTKPGR